MSNSPFSNLTTENLEETEDRVGGFSRLETDIYTGKIKAMYAGESAGGAKNVSLIVDLNGREYRETVYVTNRKGENFFLNKQDSSKKVPLPGFTIIEDICLMVTGQGLAEQDSWEEKTINLYNRDENKEVPTKVLMLMEAIDQEISLGIEKSIENQNEKQADGSYAPKADGSTREVNTIVKVFHPEHKLTVAEARNGIDEAEFRDKWLTANQGKTRDKTAKTGGNGKAGAPPKPSSGDSAPAPRKSLFPGKK